MPQFGALTAYSIAQLQDLQSDANRKGNGSKRSANYPGVAGRTGAPGGGAKKPGARVYVTDNGGIAHATGDKSSDTWKLIDGSTTYTPVNIVNPGGGGAWTLTTATYAAGVLTSSTAAAINATQTVTLKAGKYRVVGTVGRRTALVWPTLKVTLVTGTVVVVDKAYNLSTLSAASAVVDTFYEDFVVPADGNVKFDLNVKDGAGNQTGATHIQFILEANG